MLCFRYSCHPQYSIYAKNEARIGRQDRLSPIDIAGVRNYYQC